MGILEDSQRRRRKRNNVKALVLGSVAAAGILGLMIVAPNVLGAMGKLGLLPGRRQKEIINRARDRLIRQGYLIRTGEGLRLTPKGERACRTFEIRGYKTKTPRRWDRKWRVLIFDIPERRKFLREKIRTTLRLIGFVRLQDSVWVYPYDCEDLVALLKSDFKVGQELLYMTVEELEGARRLREHFGLH